MLYLQRIIERLEIKEEADYYRKLKRKNCLWNYWANSISENNPKSFKLKKNCNWHTLDSKLSYNFY